jgi:hypothetical protein
VLLIAVTEFLGDYLICQKFADLNVFSPPKIFFEFIFGWLVYIRWM